MKRRWEIWLQEAFGLDLRTLAVVRVGFAALILLDLLIRLDGLEAHYTDQGLYPLSIFLRSGFPNTLSLYSLNESSVFVASLFSLNALAAVALLTGWRTRFATFLCWVFMHSLHNRNYLLLNGGDTWLRMMLFWSIFLPLSARWSFDSVLRRSRSNASDSDRNSEGENNICNLATLAFVSQVFLVYLFAGLYKTGPAWWTDFTAVQRTMMANEWTGEPAYYLLFYPDLMAALTASVLWLELLGPWFFFSPFATGPIRTAVVWGFFAFHAGLYLFMELGIFPAVGMVSVLGLLPGWFWDRTPAAKVARRLDSLEAGAKLPPGLETKDRPYRLSLPEQFLICAAFFMVLAWNLDRAYDESLLNHKARVVIRIARLDQYWGLFAPNAPEVHSWFLAVGTLESGDKVDLMRGGELLDWSPPSSASVYQNQRTKRLLVALSSERTSAVKALLAEYYFRKWRARFPALRKVEVYRLYRTSSYRDTPPRRELYSSYENG